MNLPDVRDINDLSGKRVLLRTGLNVPIEGGEVADDFRLRRALPTIEFLRGCGAITIVIAHIGRKKADTLKPVYNYFKQQFDLLFVEDITSDHAKEVVKDARAGGVILFENLRQHEGETKNDPLFAKQLASFGELFVNDSFADSHRNHSSIVGVTQYLDSYAGILLSDEVSELARACAPEHPSIAILGGAKFETKMPLIRKFLDIYDHVAVSGALANEFFRARNLEIGRSLVSGGSVSLADLLDNKKIVLPVDVTVQHSEGMVTVKRPEEVSIDEAILDVGPRAVEQLKDMIANAKFVLWNGPLGHYESGFSRLTKQLAEIIARHDAYSIVGGGDTIAAISECNLEDKFSFVSTGGGAMLEFLLNGTLPGIETLKK